MTRHTAQKWAVHTYTFVCGGGGWVNEWCGQKRGWGGGGAEEDKWQGEVKALINANSPTNAGEAEDAR